MVQLGHSTITKHPVIWRVKLFNEGSSWKEFHFHPFIPPNKNKLSFIFNWFHWIWWSEIQWSWLKIYYNSISRQSGIVHKDKEWMKTLVFWMDCLCGRWTDWWLRPKEEKQKQFNSSLPNGKNWLFCFLLAGAAPREQSSSWMKWMGCCSCGAEWNEWLIFFSLFCGGLWAARGHNAPQIRESKKKINYEWNEDKPSSTTKQQSNQSTKAWRLIDGVAWWAEWMNEIAFLSLVFGWIMGWWASQCSAQRRQAAREEKQLNEWMKLRSPNQTKKLINVALWAALVGFFGGLWGGAHLRHKTIHSINQQID